MHYTLILPYMFILPYSFAPPLFFCCFLGKKLCPPPSHFSSLSYAVAVPTYISLRFKTSQSKKLKKCASLLQKYQTFAKVDGMTLVKPNHYCNYCKPLQHCNKNKHSFCIYKQFTFSRAQVGLCPPPPTFRQTKYSNFNIVSHFVVKNCKIFWARYARQLYFINIFQALLCIVTRLISDFHFHITGPKLTFNS